MTALQRGLSKIPPERHVLVCGVIAGNLGQDLERHPRVIWRTGDEAARMEVIPAHVARVLVSKFVSHNTFGRVQRMAAGNRGSRSNGGTNRDAALAGVDVVFVHGSTGQLKTAVYQSLGEHHPKWNPTQEEQMETAKRQEPMNPALDISRVTFVRTALLPETLPDIPVWPIPDPVVDSRVVLTSGGPRADRKASYASVREFLADLYQWDSAETIATQSRDLFALAVQEGLVRGTTTSDSFYETVRRFVAAERPAHVAQIAKRDLAVEAVLGARGGQVASRPELPRIVPPVPTSAGDAEALVALAQEAIDHAKQVIGALELFVGALPGLVEGLKEREARIGRAIAALREL